MQSDIDGCGQDDIDGCGQDDIDGQVHMQTSVPRCYTASITWISTLVNTLF